MAGLGQWLLKQDVFGHAVHVNFRGGSTYQTKLGAFCTLAMYVLTIVNTVTLFQAFLDNSKQEEKSSVQKIN